MLLWENRWKSSYPPIPSANQSWWGEFSGSILTNPLTHCGETKVWYVTMARIDDNCKHVAQVCNDFVNLVCAEELAACTSSVIAYGCGFGACQTLFNTIFSPWQFFVPHCASLLVGQNKIMSRPVKFDSPEAPSKKRSSCSFEPSQASSWLLLSPQSVGGRSFLSCPENRMPFLSVLKQFDLLGKGGQTWAVNIELFSPFFFLIVM